MNPLASALITMRRSPYQALVATVILTFTFFVAYAFSFLLAGSEVVLRFFETRPQVIAFFEISVSPEEINSVSQAMQAKSYVNGIKVVSKDEALKIYQAENKDDPLLLELVTAQILPASIEVAAANIKDLGQIKQDLETFPKIEEVVLQESVVESLSGWTTSIRLVGAVSIALLGFVSLLIMATVIGMKVVSKRPAIRIMRLIGATAWFIRSPFVFEGIIYGLVSSLLGWGLCFAAFLYATPWLSSFLQNIIVFPINPAFYLIQISVGTLLGVCLGAAAGSLAVGRMLKR